MTTEEAYRQAMPEMVRQAEFVGEAVLQGYLTWWAGLAFLRKLGETLGLWQSASNMRAGKGADLLLIYGYARAGGR